LKRLHPAAIRPLFPGLSRQISGRPAIFFDGPAGTQVPQTVADAVAGYLLHQNANHGGAFATSVESDAMLDEARRAGADLFGIDDPDSIVFGANMTTITFHFSRAISRTWKPGDEIVVSDSDHDANFSPWVLAARDRGITVRQIQIRPDDTTLDLDDLRHKLSSRTRLVAVGAASNASGTIHPVTEIARLAHEVDALVYVDAVHYTPHALVDATAWNVDFVVASAYKFFGPHAAILWGRRNLLDNLPADKVRPAANRSPDRWMTGTPAAENVAGTLAAINYLADIGRSLEPAANGRRQAIVSAMTEIARYERELSMRLITGVQSKGYKVWGITDPADVHRRVPTISITHPRHAPSDLAKHLAREGIFVWSGNFYAQPLTEALGLEPDGMVRIGLVHYNTAEEIDRLIDTLPDGSTSLGI
jgi:cysteine desulfurase family protein (TIGR01976 family)